jgi:hypothetical protein
MLTSVHSLSLTDSLSSYLYGGANAVQFPMHRRGVFAIGIKCVVVKSWQDYLLIRCEGRYFETEYLCTHVVEMLQAIFCARCCLGALEIIKMHDRCSGNHKNAWPFVFLLVRRWRNDKKEYRVPYYQGCGSAFIWSGSSILGRIPIRIRNQSGSRVLRTKIFSRPQ